MRNCHIRHPPQATISTVAREGLGSTPPQVLTCGGVEPEPYLATVEMVACDGCRLQQRCLWWTSPVVETHRLSDSNLFKQVRIGTGFIRFESGTLGSYFLKMAYFHAQIT